MAKQSNSIFTYTTIAVSAILGAWLIGVFDNAPKEEITGLDMFLSFAGFIILVGAIAASFVVYSRSNKPLMNEAADWKRIRLEEKNSYIKRFVIKQAIFSSLIFPLLILKDYAQGESVADSIKIYGIIFIVFTGLGIFAAYRFWNYYEWEFSLKNSKTKANEFAATVEKPQQS